MSHDLRPYVPRLVLEWAQETPDARYRSINGTLVFCDVSGFTALSERLARLGKLGAEELNATLNGVFSELLSRAADYDGSLLKYGGDAVLVFFWGDDHERRGTAAAAAMRAALRRVGNVQTAGGRVRLRMSVGVHSGAFDFFLVGESHRELIVAGPAATLTCDLEGTADAGEILISPDTAAAIPASCVDGAKGEGRLLRRAPAAPLPGHREIDAAVEADEFVSTALRQHLGGGGHEPEHRLVASAFLAFAGLDAALARRGGDAVADDVDRLVRSVQRHFDENGIAFLTTDVYGDGGKFFAAAGAPRTWPNNEERVLRALRAILDEPHEFSLHAGVQRGYAFAADVGPTFRRTYTLLGDVINTAARVMASAEHHQLRAMPDVIDRSATVFSTAEQPPFAAKGKKEPLVTYAIGEITGMRTSEADELPLVGREIELEELTAIGRGALGGTGNAFELVGPNGVGKTRLVSEVAARLGVENVCSATGYEYTANTAYAGARPVVAAALGLREPFTADDLRNRVTQASPRTLPWLPLVSAVFGIAVPSTPEVEALSEDRVADQLRRAVVDLLTATRREPCMWRFEDIHFIDDASRQLFADITRAARDRPWLVAVTGLAETPSFLGEDGVRIELPGLDGQESLALLRTAAPGRFLPDQAARLAEQAGGNPLFLRELAAAGTTDGVLPESVEAVVASRIDGLHPADRAKLRAASVLGLVVDGNLLRELTGAPVSPVGGLEEFLEATPSGMRFRQTVFHRAAYAGLSYRRRRALHGSAGRAIEAALAQPDDAADMLALHFLEAQLFDQAWHYSRIAARRASEVFARAESAAHYRRALEAAKHLDVPDEELGDTWEALGLELAALGQPAEVPEVLRRARRYITDPARLAHICLREGQARQQLGRPQAARRWYRRGIELARTSDDPEARRAERRILSAVAEIELRRGRMSAAIDAATETLRLAEQVNDVPGAAYARTTLGVAALMAGDVTTAEENFERGLTLSRQVGDRSGEGQLLSNLGSVAQSLGRWTDAASRFDEAASALEASGDVVLAAIAVHNSGEILLDQGHVDGARDCFERALDVFAASKSWYAAYSQRNLAVTEAVGGRFARADELLDTAIETFTKLGMADEVALARVQRAQVRLLEGNTHEALAALDTVSDDSPAAAARADFMRGMLAGDTALLERGLEKAAAAGDALTALLSRDALSRSDVEVRAEHATRAADLRERLGVESLPRWVTTAG